MRRFGMCGVAVVIAAVAMLIRSSEPNATAVASARSQLAPEVPSLEFPAWESQQMGFLERVVSRAPWLHAWLYPNSTWALAQTPITSFL